MFITNEEVYKLMEKPRKIGLFWSIFGEKKNPPCRFGSGDVTQLIPRPRNYDTTHSEEAPILPIYGYMCPPTFPQEEF